MVRTDAKFIATWVLLAVIQTVICDCMFLGPMVTVTLLPAMVMFLPLYSRTEATMLVAFAAGFAVDWASDGVLGLNMVSLVPVALVQKPLVRLFIGEDTVVRSEALSVKKSGWPRMLALVTVATALFLLIYVTVDGAGERTFGFNALRFVFSLAACIPFCAMVTHIFSSRNSRN